MPEAVTAIKLKLKLDDTTAAILDSQSRMCNWLYNHLLEIANGLRADYCENPTASIAKTLYTKTGLRNLVPSIKQAHPFLKSVHSSPLKNVALRLTDAIQTYQKSHKGQRKSKVTGWPRFRSWQCPVCLIQHHRDENSSINGLRKVLRHLKKEGKVTTLSVPGSGHVCVEKRWSWRVRPSGVRSTLRGLNGSLVCKRQAIKLAAW